MLDTRIPLTGDAARKELAALVEMRRREEFSTEFAERLLATGQITVYAPDEPACVAAIAYTLTGVTDRSDWEYAARALHAAGLCACRADALLRRGQSAVGNMWVAWRTDVCAYLAERDR